MKAMFTLTVFEILLFEGRLVLGPESERVQYSVKNMHKKTRLFLKLFEK